MGSHGSSFTDAIHSLRVLSGHAAVEDHRPKRQPPVPVPVRELHGVEGEPPPWEETAVTDAPAILNAVARAAEGRRATPRGVNPRGVNPRRGDGAAGAPFTGPVRGKPEADDALWVSPPPSGHMPAAHSTRQHEAAAAQRAPTSEEEETLAMERAINPLLSVPGTSVDVNEMD